MNQITAYKAISLSEKVIDPSTIIALSSDFWLTSDKIFLRFL